MLKTLKYNTKRSVSWVLRLVENSQERTCWMATERAFLSGKRQFQSWYFPESPNYRCGLEYTDCIPLKRGSNTSQKGCSGYDIKSHLMAMLMFLRSGKCGIALSMLLLPGPLWSQVLITVRDNLWVKWICLKLFLFD